MDQAKVEDGHTSPPPRKSRGKYVSRACVECRQRKLKCSGDDPCQRCLRRGQQCVFSDDRAIQEIVRRTRQQLVAGSLGSNASLDARVERLERSMQAVTERLDGYESTSPADEIEGPDQSGFRGDTAFQSPIDQFNESLAQVKQQLGFVKPQPPTSSPASTRASYPTQRPSESILPPLRREHSSGSIEIRIASKTFPFPSPSQYRRYLDFMFDDINACHPCVNENDFRARSEAMLANPQLERRESSFLALHYIIFACADILQEVSRTEEGRNAAGSHWYQAADDLVGRTKYSGQGDLSLVQFLIFEAFYLTHEDRPNAAFNISGLACRLCLQFGLHTQSRWSRTNDEYQIHMKQRILWTCYFVDRRIALSCGRPYDLADKDIDVELPVWVNDKEVHPNEPLPPVSVDESYMPYLSCMVQFSRLGGEIWEKMFSAGASKTIPSAETILVLDAKIKHWSENVLPAVPLMPTNKPPTLRNRRQRTLVYTRVNHLRLLLRRQMMVSMTGAPHDCRICGDLAVDVVRQILDHSDEANEPSSFRFHMAVSLGGALLILSTLLCRPLGDLGLQEFFTTYLQAFRQALALMRQLGRGLHASRRMLADLKDIIDVVERVVDQPVPQQPPMQLPVNLDNLIPYGAIDFAHQAVSGYPYETQMAGAFRQNWYEPGLNGWDGTNSHVQSATNGYGAPWI